MAFSVKKERDYAEIESKNFQMEHKKKFPKFLEITREGTRQATGVPEITHRKGTLVYYNEKLHIVDKSTNKGVYLQPVTTRKEGFVGKDDIPKKIFIEESQYEHKVEPVFLPVPFYFSPIMTAEKF